MLISCARVPQESVELSATVGRDIVQVYEAHKRTTQILFQRMKDDINKFVDEVYAPYQIGKLLEADMQDFQNNENNSLIFVLHEAGNHALDTGKQKEAVLFPVFLAGTPKAKLG